MHFHISTASPKASLENWGERYFVVALQKALRKLGCTTEVWGYGSEIIRRTDQDVVLRIAGRTLEDPVPGFPNMLWIISHPEFMLPNLIRSYQKVFIASEHIEPMLLNKWEQPCTYLPQASDPEVFPFVHETDVSGKISFVANTIYRERDFQALLRNTDLPLAYVGRGWEKRVAPELIEAEYIPNTELAGHYVRHGFVICDQFRSMSGYGFVANRLFDVLSCGAHPVVQAVPGFPDELRPYVSFVQTHNDVVAAWESWQTQDPDDKARRAREAPDIVAQRYTFDVVARQLLDFAHQALDEKLVEPQKLYFPAASEKMIKLPAEASRLRLRITDCPDIADADPENCILPDAAEPLISGGGEFDLSLTLSGRNSIQAVIDEHHALHIVARRLSRLLEVIPLVHRAGNCEVVFLDEQPNRLPFTHLTHVYDRLCSDLQDGQFQHSAIEANKRLLQYQRRVIDPEATYNKNAQKICSPTGRFAIPFALHDLAAMYGSHQEAIPEEITKSHFCLPGRKADVKLQRPVGVFIHAFYPEDLRRLLKATRFIRSKVFYISTNTQSKAKLIEAELSVHNLTSYEIRITENIGRDIYPKLFAFSDVYDRHDLVLHLHTKKSAHAKKAVDWVDAILADLLDSQEAVNRILSLFNSIPDLGLIVPRPPKHLTGGYRWTVNRHIAQAIVPDVVLPEDGTFVFPMGSMFWARTAALHPVLKTGLQAADFPAEAGQFDGTTAHAVERLIGVLANNAGYHVIKYTGSDDNRYGKFRTRLKVNKDLLQLLSVREKARVA